VDTASQERPGGVYNQPPQFNWPPGSAPSRKPYDYFMMHFPPSQWNVILDATNARVLIERGPGNKRSERDVTMTDLKKILGIRIASAIDPSKGLFDDSWMTEDALRSTMQAGRYGERFGMSKNRFQFIMKCLRLVNPQAEEDEKVMI
jgi:Transposase IS4